MPDANQLGRISTRQALPARVKSAIAGTIAGGLAGWMGRVIGLGDGAFWSQWYSANNFSGKRVTVNSALQLSAAWACVRLISETLSTLPFNVLRQAASGAKVSDTQHSLYGLLHTQPNTTMTAAVFWQCYIASLLLWGVGYAEKHYNGAQLVGIEFLQPDHVMYWRETDGSVTWYYNDPVSRETRIIPEAAMWRTPFFTLDGFTAISPIAMGANIFGGAMAADEASANTFVNGMKSSGLVTVDAVLKGTQRDEIRAHVKTVSEGGGVFVLEKGADYKQLTMNPQDAELLSTREFQISEICRWFRTDPALVGHGSKDSNWGTGLEEKMLWLVTMTLRPLAVRIEQSARMALLPVAERPTVSAEFNFDGLLRGNTAVRAAFYTAMTSNGLMTSDECRGKENLPPMGGNAAVLRVQSAQINIEDMNKGSNAAANAAKNAALTWLDLNHREPTDSNA
jgi:HK97 family phage portal protein